MNNFVSACNSFRLKINLKRTVVMYDPAPGSPYIEPTIFVEGNKLDVVYSFVYLGSTLSGGCILDWEISFLIERSSRSFPALNKLVWSQHGIKLHTKIIVYKVCVLTALLYASKTWTLYKYKLKLLEGFHQLCLRQIFHIKWQSHILHTEILGKAGLPRIQSMVMKSCLRWVGHIVRIDDGRLPRQLCYGDMWEGKRSALKPKKRFKDTIKYYLKQSGLSVDQWEKMASDRNKWRKLLHESIESFENRRMQYSAYKRLIRKGKPGPQNHHANCDIGGKLCLSLAGLKIVKNLSCTQIMSLQTKLIGCANSVAKSVAIWLALRVT